MSALTYLRGLMGKKPAPQAIDAQPADLAATPVAVGGDGRLPDGQDWPDESIDTAQYTGSAGVPLEPVPSVTRINSAFVKKIMFGIFTGVALYTVWAVSDTGKPANSAAARDQRQQQNKEEMHSMQEAARIEAAAATGEKPNYFEKVPRVSSLLGTAPASSAASTAGTGQPTTLAAPDTLAENASAGQASLGGTGGTNGSLAGGATGAAPAKPRDFEALRRGQFDQADETYGQQRQQAAMAAVEGPLEPSGSSNKPKSANANQGVQPAQAQQAQQQALMLAQLAQQAQQGGARSGVDTSALLAALGQGNGPDSAEAKKAFLAEASRASAQQSVYMKTLKTAPLSRYMLVPGAIIPGRLISKVNSDLPGQVRAEVTEDVYDSATQTQLLVPKGSRLIGSYDSKVMYGQEALLMAWTQLWFPDGTYMTLEAQPAVDSAGTTALSDEVDNHWMKIWGHALVGSFVLSAASQSQPDTGATPGQASPRQQFVQSLGQMFGPVVQQMVQKGLNVQPTLKLNRGLPVSLQVTRAMVFPGPYQKP